MEHRFLVDENLPPDLVRAARERELDARWVGKISPGAPDRKILEELRSSGDILVTRDVRFANSVFARIGMGETISGVVLIREQRMGHIREAWKRFVRREGYPEQSLVVLERNRTRIRRFPS